MIIKNPDNTCLVAGVAIKDGSTFEYIGQKGTPKFSVSLRTNRYRDESGEWKSEYMELVVWGAAAEQMKPIYRGQQVFAAGTWQLRSWTGREGQLRTSEAVNCDFIIATGTVDSELEQTPSANLPALDVLPDGDPDDLPF